MVGDDRASGRHLLEQGTLIDFKVIEEEVIPRSDEGKFGVRIRLHLGLEEDDNDVEWGGLGFMFVLAMLSFEDARPRGMSGAEYQEKDELAVVDFLTGPTYKKGRCATRRLRPHAGLRVSFCRADQGSSSWTPCGAPRTG